MHFLTIAADLGLFVSFNRICIMLSIISIMVFGVIAGYLLRNQKFLHNIEKSTSLTVFLLLFILGMSIGSNQLILKNIGRFGWQAAILAGLSLGGSILAARFVSQWFFKKGGEQ